MNNKNQQLFQDLNVFPKRILLQDKYIFNLREGKGKPTYIREYVATLQGPYGFRSAFLEELLGIYPAGTHISAEMVTHYYCNREERFWEMVEKGIIKIL